MFSLSPAVPMLPVEPTQRRRLKNDLPQMIYDLIFSLGSRSGMLSLEARTEREALTTSLGMARPPLTWSLLSHVHLEPARGPNLLSGERRKEQAVLSMFDRRRRGKCILS